MYRHCFKDDTSSKTYARFGIPVPRYTHNFALPRWPSQSTCSGESAVVRPGGARDPTRATRALSSSLSSLVLKKPKIACFPFEKPARGGDGRLATCYISQRGDIFGQNRVLQCHG